MRLGGGGAHNFYVVEKLLNIKLSIFENEKSVYLYEMSLFIMHI